MIIRKEEKLVTIGGVVVKDANKKDGGDATLGGIMIGALVAEGGVGAPADGKERFERYQLAKKIHEASGEVELDIDDVAKIKTLIGTTYGTLVVGPAWELLEAAASLSKRQE